MKKGFTLAEVLITLGIIGVVAALTLPTLISKHQKKVYVTQFKKAYNTVTNAFKLMQAESGSDNLADNDFMSALAVNSPSNEAEVTKLAKKYFNIVQDVRYYPFNSGSVYYKYLFYSDTTQTRHYGGYLLKTADGAEIYLYVHSNGVNVEIDVNGSDRGPNTCGRDFFNVNFDLQGNFRKTSADGTCSYEVVHSDEEVVCAERVIREGWEMNY